MSTYRGKILDVDLSTGTIKTTPISEEWQRKYIGGSGLAARLFLDRVPPDVDPLGEKNVFFVMTGPFAGTTYPGASRFTLSFKSPLTGIWGETCSGGNFAPELKAAGYDGIAISGVSSKPVYLMIDDDKVELKDASALWGKGTYETTDLLKEREEGNRKVRVLAIGQAGENLVKYALVQNDKGNSAGRAGAGTVMGAKKLKAIAVRGSGKVQAARPKEYDEVRKATFDKVKESMLSQALKAHGTNMGMQMGAMTGDVPTKNWTQGDASAFAPKVGGAAVTEKYLTKVHACVGCPIASKRVCKVDEGPYKTEEGPGPEYETAAALGPLVMNDNLESIIKMNEICNDAGIDSISAGSSISFGMQCFENGLITSKDLNGGQLRWGNIDDIMTMLNQIVNREGFGDVLADGTRIAAKKIGKNAADYAVEVKGLEAPMHDPRAIHGLGLAYAMSNRGACHVQHTVLYCEGYGIPYPDIGLVGGYQQKVSEGKGQVVYLCENLGQLNNAGVLCEFSMLSLQMPEVVDMYNAVTGFDYDLKELMECGERIWLLKRGLNNLMGITSADDRLPKNIMTAVSDGGAAGSVPDMELMLKEYYPIRGLNHDGRPTKEKLESLGLSKLAAKL